MPDNMDKFSNGVQSGVKLAVLMSVYNEEHYIAKAIESILTQSYNDYTFYIVDDCSTDATQQIIESYKKYDSRIVLIKNNTNLKLASSLNKALSMIDADYIARMDADDVSHPERLSTQMAFLKRNPHIDVCGTGYFVPERQISLQNPEHDADIRVRMLFGCELVHPSVVLKKSVLDAVGGYPVVTPCEDYALWIKLMLDDAGYVFANVPDVLMEYSWRNYLQGNTPYMQQTSEQTWIARSTYLQGAFKLSENELDLLSHQYLCNGYDESQLEPKVLCRIQEWTTLLLQKSLHSNHISAQSLYTELKKRCPSADITMRKMLGIEDTSLQHNSKGNSMAINPTVISEDRVDLGGNMFWGDPQSFSPLVFKYIIERFSVKSMLDLGSGTGYNSSYIFNKYKIPVVSCDGLLENCTHSVFPTVHHDLTEGPFICKADLILSVELVEHLEERYVENLIRTFLCGKTVLMTHGLPGQEGYHHVNNQPSEYWINALTASGFTFIAQDTQIIRHIAGQERHGFSYFVNSGLVFARM